MIPYSLARSLGCYGNFTMLNIFEVFKNISIVNTGFGHTCTGNEVPGNEVPGLLQP